MFSFRPKLTDNIATSILTAFANWMHTEYTVYKGDNDTCMIRNIATTHPSVFNDLSIGTKMVERYFIMSNSSDQRVATRLAIFISKLNVIFGSDIIDQFKARCIESMLKDLLIDKSHLESYLKLSALFWTYPILVMIGTLELEELVPNIQDNDSAN